MQSIMVASTIKAAWEIFLKRPFFLVGAVLLVLILSSIVSALPGDNGAMVLVLAALVVNVLVELGLIAFILKAHDDVAKVKLADLWYPKAFLPYLAVKIMTTIAVLIGLVFLIVPGIVLALMFIFATYLVVDTGKGPIEALKESSRITKGHKWGLFVLMLALIGINILGLLALGVGLLISVPVSLLAIAHTYRLLSKASPAPATA
jgi:uncharacterized membrane protein